MTNIVITDEQRAQIRAAHQLCKMVGLDPTVRQLEGFSGLRLTHHMVHVALADPVQEEAVLASAPEETEIPEVHVIGGVRVVRAQVILAPPNTPNRIEGYNWISGLEPGDSAWHEKWGRLIFLRWDGGYCVCEHTRTHLDPAAPADMPQLGAIPKGSKIHVDPNNLWVQA